MFSSLIKRATINSCFIFSSIVVAYALLVTAFFNGVGMNPTSVILLYPFSFATALAFGLAKHTKLKTGAKLGLHFLIFTLAVILFVYLPHGGMVSSKSALLLFVIYCIIYAIVACTVLSINGKKKRVIEKNTEYKNVY